MAFYIREPEETLGSILGKSLGPLSESLGTGISGIIGARQDQQRRQNLASMLEREGLPSELSDNPQLIPHYLRQRQLEQKQEARNAQLQAKEEKAQLQQQEAEEAERQEAQDLAQQLNKFRNVYMKSTGLRKIPGIKSSAAKAYESGFKTLKQNKLFKKLGLTIPDYTLDQEEYDSIFRDNLSKLQSLFPQRESTQSKELSQSQSEQLPEEKRATNPVPSNMLGINPTPVAQQEPFNIQNAIGGILSSIGAGVGGLPKNILETVASLKGIGSRAGESLVTALGGPEIPQEMKADREQFAQVGEALREAAPTRESLEKKLPYAPTGKESDLEQSLREFAGDVGEQLGFSVLTGGVGNIASALKNAGIVQGSGNVAKFLGKKLGLESSDQEALKVGTSLLAAYKTVPGLKDAAKKSYTQMIESIPSDAKLENGEHIRLIKNAAERLTKGGSGFGPISPTLDRVLLEPKPLVKDVAELIKEASFKKLTNKDVLEHLKDMREAFKLEVHSNKSLPKIASQALKVGDEIFSASKALENANEFLSHNKNKKGWVNYLVGNKSFPLRALFAGVGLGKEATASLKVFANNPEARKVYIQMMHNIFKNNPHGFIKSAKYLKNILE